MQLKDISFPTPQENVFFDEVLFQLADKNGRAEYLRFWESPSYFVVLGRIGKEEEDVNASATQADGVPVLRRTSGGGTVVQGPGCLNYTFILSKQNNPILNDLRASYAWISAKIIEALAALNVKAVFRPISDIALEGGELKISGNAQRRGKTHILHHGTILYNFDLDVISKYLNMPKDMPDYRKGRSHKEFVTNIAVKPAEFKAQLIKVLEMAQKPQVLTSEEISALKNYLK
jgi:lipoate-protein ligase A